MIFIILHITIRIQSSLKNKKINFFKFSFSRNIFLAHSYLISWILNQLNILILLNYFSKIVFFCPISYLALWFTSFVFPYYNLLLQERISSANFSENNFKMINHHLFLKFHPPPENFISFFSFELIFLNIFI